MNRYIKVFCFIIHLIISFTKLFAREEIGITKLSIQNGLSNNSVRCVFQDSRGYLWLGTFDGLNRYDGSQFSVYRNVINDTTSLPNNYIYCLGEDIHKNIWVGTGQGVAVYDNIHDIFLPVSYESYPTQKIKKATFNALAISSDKTGNIYIGSENMGFFVKSSTLGLLAQVPLEINQKETNNYSVQSIVVQGKKVWLFINKVGLCEYDIELKKIHIVNEEVKFSTCMQIEIGKTLWIGTNNGLYSYSIETRRYLKHYISDINSLSSNHITSLSFDRSSNLWIGTKENGISILEQLSKRFQYKTLGNDSKDLSSGAIFSIVSDNEFRMWIGTHNGGCNVVNYQRNNFTTVMYKPFTSNTLASNYISSFCENDKNELLIGTDGGGLSIWNRTKDTYINYKNDPKRNNSLMQNTINCISKDFLGNIWLATNAGIDRFNKKSGTFEHYHCFIDKREVEDNTVLQIYQDKHQDLWATTFDVGALYRFNRILNKFELFSKNIHNGFSIFEDSEGWLWIGTPNNLIKIDKTGKECHTYYNIGKPVRAIFEDTKHKIWIGTIGGGLVCFDKQKGRISERYSDSDGLCNNAILNIQEDKLGYLWLSTFNGLTSFDSKTKKTKNFFHGDGLQSNQFSFGAGILLGSGEIAFGGIEGFTIFSAEKIVERNYMPPLFLKNVTINNKSLTENCSYINKIENGEVREIKIPYSEAVLSLSYNALEYSSPEKIFYAYYLDGFDKEWINAKNIKNINYNNLHEGKYVLYIKNTDVNGVWNEKKIEFSIIVTPPWYRSQLAYLIYFSLIVWVVYLFTMFLKEKNRLRFKVQLEELNAEKEKELSESRQSFFTNVIHEFRTPLTLIINPIKDLLQSEISGEIGEKLTYTYKNAYRLLSLVDQLLLFKKTENGISDLQLVKFDLHKLCYDIFLMFTELSKLNKIDYSFKCPSINIQIIGDKEKVGTVFYNILSNAFKYTPEGGQIIFTLDDSSTQVEVSISDTGSGIPSNFGSQIFEKYYRIPTTREAQKPGFGIGLFLVSEFIKLHNGTVTYSSNTPCGTNFLLRLPKGKLEEYYDFEKDEDLSEITVSAIEIDITEKNVIQNGKLSNNINDGLGNVVSEKYTVLIVEDNLQLRDFITNIFAKEFIVYEASTAEKGLILAIDVVPDVIISDLIMVEKSGIDFCRTIIETPNLSHVPFVLITGNYSEETRLQCIKLGVDDYILKPFDKDLLIAKVKNLLHRHQNLKKYFFDDIIQRNNNFKISTEAKEILDQCITTVEKNLGNDSFNNQMLADELGMSYNKLFKHIKTITGHSVSTFIRYIRLSKAAELLISTNMNVNETAFFVGYSDIKHFREQFTKMFGLRPSDYVEKYRKNFGKEYKLNKNAKRK